MPHPKYRAKNWCAITRWWPGHTKLGEGGLKKKCSVMQSVEGGPTPWQACLPWAGRLYPHCAPNTRFRNTPSLPSSPAGKRKCIFTNGKPCFRQGQGYEEPEGEGVVIPQLGTDCVRGLWHFMGFRKRRLAKEGAHKFPRSLGAMDHKVRGPGLPP